MFWFGWEYNHNWQIKPQHTNYGTIISQNWLLLEVLRNKYKIPSLLANIVILVVWDYAKYNKFEM